MNHCIEHIKGALSVEPDRRVLKQSFDADELSKLRTLNADDIDTEAFYNIESDQSILQNRPWKSDVKYFNKVYISALALLKMTVHAKSGGSIEIMGMLTGKVMNKTIIVMDVYSLPVEGTETRVNAQLEAYEYMVQYLDSLKSAGHKENIVGWYHSHPGYGCWLSGIDVATQSLNQNFQDPYLAIVVDPIKTMNQGKVEIGAFRTYPEKHKSAPPSGDLGSSASGARLINIKSKTKQKDYGAHSDKYYALDIEIFRSKQDQRVLDLLLNKSWVTNLVKSRNFMQMYDVGLIEKILTIITKFQIHNLADMTRYEVGFVNKFNYNFAAMITPKLLANNYSSERPLAESQEYADDIDDDSVNSQSDYENSKNANNVLDVSDVDDAISIDSSRPPSRKKNKEEESTDGFVDEERVEKEYRASLDEAVASHINLRKRMLHTTVEEPDELAAEESPFGYGAQDSPYTSYKDLLYSNKKKALRMLELLDEDPIHRHRGRTDRRDGVSPALFSENLAEEDGHRVKRTTKSIVPIDKESRPVGQMDLEEYVVLRTQRRIFK